MPVPDSHATGAPHRLDGLPVGQPKSRPEPPPGPPARPPLGLHLARVAREITRAFDDALAEAGGSQPIWLVLISLKTRRLASQRELADAVGIREATLTHHLNAMDAGGLITRRRDPENRRVHLVELTQAGEEAFYEMRGAALAFNERLTAGFDENELTEFGRVLDRLRGNVSGEHGERPPDVRAAVITLNRRGGDAGDSPVPGETVSRRTRDP
jgi:MarR family transcriptional regulator, transcriptional regulator for hemolysin